MGELFLIKRNYSAGSIAMRCHIINAVFYQWEWRYGPRQNI
jgi:hypothetical protein